MTYKVFIQIGTRKIAIEVEADNELEAREVTIHKVEKVQPIPTKQQQQEGKDFFEHLKNTIFKG